MRLIAYLPGKHFKNVMLLTFFCLNRTFMMISADTATNDLSTYRESNYMNVFKTTLIASLLAFTLPGFAQTTGSASVAAPASTAPPASPVSTDTMTDGSVTKVNAEQQKITLKHGPIANLDMPGMTMVFRVKDPAMINAVKPGDNIQFRAEKIDGAITITHIQAAK